MAETENAKTAAPWAADIPEGDFVSKAPTYESGKWIPLFEKRFFKSSNGVELKYYFYDPTQHGYDEDGVYPLLSFLHGTSNSLVGDLCVNYTGAEYYASPDYQKTMGGAYVLVPVANEYTGEDGRVKGYFAAEYLEPVHELIMSFIAERAERIGKRFLFGNSSGATFVLRLMDTYMDDFDVVIPVGSTALPDDAGLDRYDEKGKYLFFAIGRRDEFHNYEKEVEPRLARLRAMKHCFIFIPEWVRNGDGGIASIIGSIEMGQHCLMNGVQSNLILDDGTLMDERLPRGMTGWIADVLAGRA
ncbi:MAG: hypothetical protein IKX54_01470 [Lachnospiraceae bacterium]|nr:hypothetical protein [Lachnospiraceae bacterium]